MRSGETSIIALQLRVVGALVLRETRATFGSSQIGYLWAILTPTATIFILVLIFSVIGREPPFGSSFAAFFATGILTLELFSKMGNSLMTVFEANRALMTYPLVKPMDVVFARGLLIAATYALIMAAVLTCLLLLDLARLPAHPEGILAAFLLTALLGFGFGLVNAVILTLWDSWRYIEKILTKPLFFLSGVFYVPSYLPAEAVNWLSWNPVLHCVEWLRNGMYANYDSRVLDRDYLVAAAVLLVFAGLLGERLTRRSLSPA